ncbi:MAG: hypothetical protein JSS56_17200 [Proteobacteria bacterium]|nr:hypothetical protein [Pseudomonadota bacterium]
MSTINKVLQQLDFQDLDDTTPELPLADTASFAEERNRQFRLSRIQLKDWGTYHGLVTLDVPEKGQLFVGHSGSGKSTIFDAHSVLLTPPQRLRLNQASRDSGKTADDRSVINYVRGVWGTAQGEDGRGVAKLLRPGTTWSAIAEVYRNPEGKVVTLAHLYWLRGASNDLHRRYLLAQREFDLRELDFFAESDFDTARLHRTLKQAGVEPFEAFSRYMAAFTKDLGIRDDMALLLLHKTQSTKSVDSITAFLREFMLDEPKTFEVAKDVVNQFQKLNEAHSDWTTATEQRDVLMPAREAHQLLQDLVMDHSRCREIVEGVALFATPLGIEVHDRAITRGDPALKAQKFLLASRAKTLEQAEGSLAEAIRREALGGGDQLRYLSRELEQARERLQYAETQSKSLSVACATLKRTVPSDEREFAELHAQAVGAIDDGASIDTKEFQAAAGILAALEPSKSAIEFELAALTRMPRSNVPAEQQEIRRMLADALDVNEEAFPFAAELMSVKTQDKKWQGALERLTRGFGVTMLVPLEMFQEVRRLVDRKHLKGRLDYRPVRPISELARARLPANAASKIDVTDHAFHCWIVNEIHRQFDYACVESPDQMDIHPRALSLNGQIKRAGEHYVKDDRSSIHERTRWVLGTDTAARAEALQNQLQRIREKLDSAQTVIDQHERDAKDLSRRLQAFVTVRAIQWGDLDSFGAQAAIDDVQGKIEALERGSPELKQLQEAVAIASGAKDLAQQSWAEQLGVVQGTQIQLTNWTLELQRLGTLPVIALTPTQQHAIDEMRLRRSAESTPDNYDRELSWLREESNKAVRTNETAQTEQKGRITQALAVFCAKTEWKPATKGHDPVLESFEFFDQHLTGLLLEGVSRTWERFLQELQEHNSHQLTLLHQSLTSERADMAKRLLAVNASLERTAYNEKTHLFLHRIDCEPEESQVFRRDLALAMGEVVNVDGPDAAKMRFDRLRRIAERLGSDRSEDIRWRSRVLDVRQHVQFDAHEIIDGTSQVEQIYSGSDGKSGGQKQKLAATCMAAALRYQLAPLGGAVPQFATVVVDEAFDRSDPDFTEAALNVFRELGFQIIVATPGKMVQTIEPYVGGAVWVYARRGDRSNAIPLNYDVATGRIDYSAMTGQNVKADGAFTF